MSEADKARELIKSEFYQNMKQARLERLLTGVQQVDARDPNSCIAIVSAFQAYFAEVRSVEMYVENETLDAWNQAQLKAVK